MMFQVGDRVVENVGFAYHGGVVEETYRNNFMVRVKRDAGGYSLVDSRKLGHAPQVVKADLADLELRVAARVLADDNRREEFPLYDGLFAYFPAALCEVARWSKVGGAKHTPGEPLHWAREKSTDHENKILRHLLDADKDIDDGFIEAVALAWRSLALCQTLLEKRGWAEGANARWKR